MRESIRTSTYKSVTARKNGKYRLFQQSRSAGCHLHLLHCGRRFQRAQELSSGDRQTPRMRPKPSDSTLFTRAIGAGKVHRQDTDNTYLVGVGHHLAKTRQRNSEDNDGGGSMTSVAIPDETPEKSLRARMILRGESSSNGETRHRQLAERRARAAAAALSV